MSPSETADYLGLSIHTIYHRINERSIPHHKVPGSNLVRFDQVEVDKWMESGAIETVAQALKGGSS
jgi:excisionase family DNA binding protein